MDEEIDLRPYLELLIRRWYLIIGAAVLGGLIAFGLTSQQEKVYKATALIAVTQNRLIARFDPRLDTSEEPQPLKVLPELATSDDILTELIGQLVPPLEDVETIADIRGALDAAPGEDPSLIRLSTEHINPADAARISNQWASVFVIKANELFGDGDGDQLSFFEDQRSQAEEELAAAESSLIEFQGINRQAIHRNKVDALNASQQTMLTEQQELRQLESSVQNLRDQIGESNDKNPASFADQLTALVLQLRVFNPAMELPVLLQLNGTNGLSRTTPEEQVATLEHLQETVSSRLTAIQTELDEIEPQLLELQEDLQKAQAEHNQLSLNRDVAEETYLSLARKADEERITAADVTRGIRLASRAAAPEKPEGPRKLFVIAIASTIFAVIAIVIIVVVYWWKQPAD